MDKYEINQIYKDEFGRVSGIFAYNKPAGVSSHDIVYKFRKHFETRKVGHAGTLDPFASGLLLILVGKATKLSDSFLNKDKVYKAQILLGLETLSGDPEGKIIDSAKTEIKVNVDSIKDALTEFVPEYIQTVPVFSSVKVDGEKLRELARSFDRFEVIKEGEKSIIQFYKENELAKSVELPAKKVSIYKVDFLESGVLSKEQVLENFNNVLNTYKKEPLNADQLHLGTYPYITISAKVSKGTYIRQFAIDLGNKLQIPSTLINLERTQIGDFTISDTYEL